MYLCVCVRLTVFLTILKMVISSIYGRVLYPGDYLLSSTLIRMLGTFFFVYLHLLKNIDQIVYICANTDGMYAVIINNVYLADAGVNNEGQHMTKVLLAPAVSTLLNSQSQNNGITFPLWVTNQYITMMQKLPTITSLIEKISDSHMFKGRRSRPLNSMSSHTICVIIICK